MASHSLPGSSQANSGSPPAIKSSYSKSPMGELDPVYKLSAASMTLMGADDVRKDNALLMVGANSGSTITTLASPWSSMKATIFGSSRVLMVLSTARSEEHTSDLQSL